MEQQDLGFAEDFGQKVDLTQRIREVLANYPEGTTILKELLQNADDAGATTVSFCLDRRQHGTDSLVYGCLAEWQGPALLAFNNAQFGEEDFESISRIGDSKKRGQAWKTGRFGVGFNSVYHLSDLPSFVSGRYVVMFDPHCKFLPQVSLANPGKRFDFVSTHALDRFKDQFVPYCAFGCDMESPYAGTLFRFPLRNDQQATVSRLSRQSYSEEDMSNLLHNLYLEGVSAMLFLKNVEAIEIYEWHKGMESPQQTYICRIDTPTAEIRWHRRVFSRLSRAPLSASQGMNNYTDVYSVQFVSEAFAAAAHVIEEKTESFLIAQAMGAASSRVGAMVKNAAKDHDLHFLPWASLAAKVTGTGQKAQDEAGLEGQAFCFLPLPVKTGLPVHVNGYFELSSNRRDIWYGADMDRGGKLRSDWNRCLLEDVVAPTFTLLLSEASKQFGPITLYNSLWPCGSFAEPWLSMVKRFYISASELPLLHTAAVVGSSGGRWLTPKEALYHDEEFVNKEELAQVLIAKGFPLVRPSMTLRNMLFMYCVPNPRMVLPRLIRSELRKPGKHVGLVDQSNALVLLEYCLGDVIDEEAVEVLSGLPLIPLANGALGVFEKKGDRKGLSVICNELEFQLVRSLPGVIVDMGIPKELFERLTNIARVGNASLCCFSYVLLAQQFLNQILPPEWKGVDEVEWKPDLVSRYPNEDWLILCWQYLRENCKTLSSFEEWPLLPTTTGHLCRLRTNSKVLRSSGVWSSSIEGTIVKLGCQILRNGLGVEEHQQLSAYVHSASAAGVLDTIFVAASHQLTRVPLLFAKVSNTERRELRKFLSDGRWYAGNQLSDIQLHVLKSLPIFEVYSGAPGSSDDDDDDDDDDEKTLFVHLLGAKVNLAPLGMDKSLLGPEFLHSSTQSETQWLAGPLGVVHLGRPLFYTRRVLNRLHELSPKLRDQMMLCILKELPQLAAVDPSIREVLKHLAFVPTASGTLRTPSTLYDPRSMELTALLDDQESFPVGIFVAEEVLEMLQGLGLKVGVVPETLVQSARQVEALMGTDRDLAHKKGQALLSYLVLNASRWLLPQPFEDVNKTLGGRMFHKVSTMFQGADAMSLEMAMSSFWNELRNICWCPVLLHPPHPHLPWPLVDSAVAPPQHVRLQEDMWLVSASMRILDGECRSLVLASKLGWASRPSGRCLAAQLLELGKNHVVVEDQGLGQALATAVPRIYVLLNEMLGSDEMEIVKAVLEGSRWVWVGDGFASVREVAFSGPLHLTPYLRVIPADLVPFKELLVELGVRETLTPNEFALILSNMANDKQGAPLDSWQLNAAVWLVQHLADLHFNGQEATVCVPDENSILVPASKLVYNDAPWLSNTGAPTTPMSAPLTGQTRTVATTTGLKFVHAKISTDVAERMGVRSLRRMMLAESADSMDLGLHDAAEAFGQHEALTTRLKNIVDMYVDGPGILCELVQNADDAGATQVSFLLDRSEYGTSSVLSPKMADWQGPALYCCNDSVFTARDLYAISRIGQDSKLEKPSAIGRFGLGFNSVYHFTDIPGFISGGNLVMFDPHASHLPGITPSHPGLKISFVGRGLLEQFPDQLHPYLLFGCDLRKPYPGTLFRFPLRTAKTAASSEIKQETYSPEDVLSLFASFKSSAEEAMLFLRNVASIAVYVRDDPSHDMQLLYQVERPSTPQSLEKHATGSCNLVYEFVRGDPQNPIDKEEFYRKLIKTPESQLPWQCQKVEIKVTMPGMQTSHTWLVSNAMGGKHAREQAVAPENRARGFVPWAGIAALLLVPDQLENGDANGLNAVVEGVVDAEVVPNGQKAAVISGGLEGRAFCFLPLPVKIGLPVHVNGYFELSSNRRDIWYGDDMAGGGKLRSNWNQCLLEDVAAPAYARLLSEAARELGPTTSFHVLWPTGATSDLWASLMRQVYKAVVELDLPVLYTHAAQGKWMSPKRAVFPDNSFAEAHELTKALAEVGLPIITAPEGVVKKFQEICPWLHHLTPRMLRKTLGARRILVRRSMDVLALKYCLTDVNEVDAGDKLQGLSLLPLCDDLFGMFAKSGAGERILVTTSLEFELLKDAVPYMLIDREIDSDVFLKLQSIAKHGRSNLCLLSGPILEELLPRLVPADWRGKAVVAWTPGVNKHPGINWMELLWKYFESTSVDLEIFSEWPLLPTTDGQLRRLMRNSQVLKNDGWSENMVAVLQRAKCSILRADVSVNHAKLGDYVHEASAFGVLNVLQVAVSGQLHLLAPLLKGASDGELRELRSFLCQSKWFSSGTMDAPHLQVLRSLPVFESYSSSGGRSFVDLSHSKRWFAPDGIDDGLLGDSFVQAESQKEAEVLSKYLGITKLSKTTFYRDHLFSHISQIPVEVTRRTMLTVIQDLPKLLEEDPALEEILSGLPFVATAQGTLEAPKKLYDPRVPELQTLLNKQVYFPSGDFASDAILDVLVQLGLRRSLGNVGLLDSARSVTMISGSDIVEAVRRAKALLVHLDDLELARESMFTASSANPVSSNPVHSIGVNGAQAAESSTSTTELQLYRTDHMVAVQDLVLKHAEDNKERTLTQYGGDNSDEIDTDFWMQLTNINWCPVLMSAPDPKLPWQQVPAPIAPPKLVRPKSQMWLVSATMRILDGDCQSVSLASKLGWRDPPNAGLLAAQLIELSKCYLQWRDNSTVGSKDRSEAMFNEMNATLSKEIPAMYSLLQDRLGTQEIAVVESMLEGVRWVWVGEGFVLPTELAFNSPAHFYPYLHSVPPQIAGFRKLLMALGVRETFEVGDYARVLFNIATDTKGRVLTPEQLTFCFSVLHALADALPASGGSSSNAVLLGSVLVPNAAGILVQAKELVYNDAPWLPKSALEMTGVNRLVHTDIENELAKRLGAKSLRYLSLVDQEMTRDLPCLSTISISEKLSGYGHDKELLLYNFLEIADCCKARKIHVLYDKREHPRQSLLQPNLGQFQGPALTIAFEGAVLSTEEVCILQDSPPAKLHGHSCQYGSGLLGAYHLTSLPFIVSGGYLYLFDPSGQILASSLADGGAAPSGSPAGKAYVLKGTDLAQRFSDQFLPLRVSSELSWARSDSTIIRMPLHSAEQAANFKFANSVECGDADIRSILDKFKAHASSSLLFMKAVEDVSVTVWEEGEPGPSELFGVRVDPARAVLRNPFQDRKWGNFKYQLSTMFGSSSSASKVHTIDMLLTENQSKIVDKWLVVQTLGSGHTRDMALDRKYLSYNFTPIAGVAAHISRNGVVPTESTDGCILAPLPLPIATGLPVTIMGHFLVSHGSGTRHLFQSLTSADLKRISMDRHQPVGRVPPENVAAAWNKELLLCVRDSYLELLQEVQRLRLDPTMSRADPPIGRGLDGTHGIPAERAYSFWPRSHSLLSTSGSEMESSGPEQVYAVDRSCIVEWLIKPMYMRLVELPMWQLHGGAMAKVGDGMFLSPAGTEQQGMAPPATVCDFLKSHYRVFAVPWELTKEMEAAGVSAKVLTPKMLRALLRVPSVAAAVPSVVTQVDLLEFCCADLYVDNLSISTSRAPHVNSARKQQPDEADTQFIRPLSRELGAHANRLHQGSGSAARARPAVLRAEQQTQTESRLLPQVLDGQDPMDWFSEIGRALVDLGAAVIPEVTSDAAGTQGSVRLEDEDTTLDRSLVLEMKGLLCPTATGEMAKMGISELWVGNKEQQELLQGLASKFVHPLCIERAVLTGLFHHRTFQSLLNLQPFSSHLLAANLRAVLPKYFIQRSSSVRAVAASSVAWTDIVSPMTGPTKEWLRLFWANVNVASADELSLFSQWPLIPCISSTPILVRVGQSQLVFMPPTQRVQTPNSSGEDSSSTILSISDIDRPTRGFLELESQHPWLLPLLRDCNVPVFDHRFLDCQVAELCSPPEGFSLARIVVSKFLALQQAGCLSPSELTLQPTNCDALFSFLAASTHHIDVSMSSSAALAYNSDELELLRSLPIYKTRRGFYVSVDPQLHCVVPPNVFLQPDDELCLQYQVPEEGGLLYLILGIPELTDHEVMARFALPGFSAQTEREQERILAYLHMNWATMRQNEAVVSAMRATKFIRSGDGGVIDDGSTRSLTLFAPPDLLDPQNLLLKRVFSADVAKFPSGQFATAGWLSILRVAGLRSVMDASLLLDCAVKVEELGQQSSQTSELGNAFDVSEVATDSGSVSTEVWTTAGMLTEALLSNFASVYGTNFCEALGRIAFVPAERGIPNVGGAAGGTRKVLAAYSEAVLLKDWPLAWTSAPILAMSSVVPPEFSWGAFRLRSPPTFPTVLAHLEMVGKNRGEDVLARWPNVRGMRSVEDTFGDVLKYLTNAWNGLSSSDKEALQRVHFIPVANGTRLAMAASLFARLGMDLAPFVFELPSAYLAYMDVLTSLGLQDSPMFEIMRTLLLQIQRSLGYQRLNPNELRAVLRILHFICDKDNRARAMVGHVLPDPAEDAIVPDDMGRLVQAKACVFVDMASARLVGEIDASWVRFVHPHVPEELCKDLGVRKLSEVVTEELDESKSLQMVDKIGPFVRTSVAERLRSPAFAEAMWAVVQETGEAVPSLRQGMTNKVDMVQLLQFAADGLWFVQRLYTRFFMLPGHVDVTRRSDKSSSLLLLGDEVSENGHRVFEFVDKSKDRLLIAQPPECVTVPDLLAIVVSRLIGSPVSLPIGALFLVPAGTERGVLHMLRQGSNVSSNEGTKNSIKNSGVPGMELLGSDTVLVQCHPLRPFHSGEIVAWRTDGQGSMRYGRVMHDTRASAGQALYRLEVETGPGEIRMLLSSQVFFFKGTTAASPSAVSLETQRDVNAGVSSLTGASQPHHHRLAPETAGPGSQTAAQKKEAVRQPSVTGNVPAAEVVQAVRDMLTAAGVPMGSDQSILLEHSLSLQEQLSAVDTALSVEQERAEVAVKEAEAARTAWMCRVCLSNEVDTIVVPCGHVLCYRCSMAVTRCPFCRHQVTRAQRIYRP